MPQVLIKSSSRVRDHGEVFTPDFIVNDMLDLVNQETIRLESRFLEPACGDWNFLIQVLIKKITIVNKKYAKNQFDYEKNAMVAMTSIYGIELLPDNAVLCRERLYNYLYESYILLFKKSINNRFLLSIRYVLSKNILQWDALSLKDAYNEDIVFCEWSLMDGNKIKRRDFIFDTLINNHHANTQLQWTLFGDTGEPVFIPKPIKEYYPINFLDIYMMTDDLT